MSDVTREGLLRIVQGLGPIREDAKQRLANQTPETAYMAGFGLIIAVGNAGVNVPLFMVERICDAAERAVREVAAENGIEL